MMGMTAPLEPAELRSQVERFGPVAYLVTISPETARPHVVSAAVRWDGDALVCGAGARTAANIGDGADVSLVWPPVAGGAYSLIVDGPASILDGDGGDGGRVASVRPAGAVLHRQAGADGDGPGCIAVVTAVTAAAVAAAPAVHNEEEEHPNARVVRRFLEAWFDGDFATWTTIAADDIVIHMRGRNYLNGSYRGVAGVLDFFEKFAALDIDSMDMQVEDVAADDRFVVAMMRNVYQRQTETFDLRTACVYRIDPDGRIAEVWTVSDQQAEEARFFTMSDGDPSGLGVGLGLGLGLGQGQGQP